MCNDPLYHKDNDVRKSMEACVEVMKSEGAISIAGAAEFIIDQAGSCVRNIGRSPGDRINIFNRALDVLVKRRIFASDDEDFTAGSKMSKVDKPIGSTSGHRPPANAKPVFIAPPMAGQSASEPALVGAGGPPMDLPRNPFMA